MDALTICHKATIRSMATMVIREEIAITRINSIRVAAPSKITTIVPRLSNIGCIRSEFFDLQMRYSVHWLILGFFISVWFFVDLLYVITYLILCLQWKSYPERSRHASQQPKDEEASLHAVSCTRSCCSGTF